MDPAGSQGAVPRAAQVARRRYFPAVEGMRAVAALSVLFGHVLLLTHLYATSNFGPLYNVGNRLAPMGVYIFFVISGFLIYRPFIAARAEAHSVAAFTPRYLVRRAVRIVPAYWVALTLLAIWPGIPGVFADHWWVCYGFLQIYSPDGWGAIGLAPAWTLCVEITFYLTLPLLALFLQTRGVHSGHDRELRWELVSIAALAAISLVVRAVFFPIEDLGYLGGTLLGTFSWFCAGMFLAAFEISPSRSLDRVRSLLSNPAICWPPALLLLAVWVSSQVPAPDERQTLATFAEGVQVFVIAGLLVAPAVFGDARASVRRTLANRVMVYLGTISYGIYLYHWTIAEWLSHQSFVTGVGVYTLTELVTALVFVIALASLSWFLIEKPLMTRVKSIKALRSPAGPTVDSAKALAEPAP